MRVAIVGPFSGSVRGLADCLAGLGYAPSTIVQRVRWLARMSRWLQAEGLSASEFDSVTIGRFLATLAPGHEDMLPTALRPLLSYLRSVAVIPEAEAQSLIRSGPADTVLAEWAAFLVGERGLKESTVRYYRGLARPFLLTRVREDSLELAGLDAQAVSAYVREHIPGMTVGTAKLTVTALRSLLRFLFLTGLVSKQLDQVVPARAGYRDWGLPRGLSSEQLAALIAAIDPSTGLGKRDLAIVVLLARLGLRAGEVAVLRLDDIDWRAGTLRIAGKGGQIDLLPLPTDAGEALAAHLSAPRHLAAEGRALFFGSSAPYLPLSVSGVIAVVRRAGRRAGLGPVGAHRLRHSVATSTINAGASLQEVAQLLRHRHVSSTTIYAKVDLTRLCAIARPWPGPVGSLLVGGVR